MIEPLTTRAPFALIVMSPAPATLPVTVTAFPLIVTSEGGVVPPIAPTEMVGAKQNPTHPSIVSAPGVFNAPVVTLVRACRLIGPVDAVIVPGGPIVDRSMFVVALRLTEP